eukprot:CAMPEP_0175051162 /NCGR_PEP_ID=MMETSP0052_2-20121109/7644_1 /TAXON_ID=51329 ORGANISM="Polytomella parva, Strain SAG 63-3" /NCGR_SAMPLE_ID=MMETSP0052_2 /ASSEMBLY_ACC=CAM_ASM_000194 /LENGTH=280 /DNA_ID=CAMNT_0016315411 /DNA_START=1 /DNA_END=843 /DNA_ORIENTATION=+
MKLNLGMLYKASRALTISSVKGLATQASTASCSGWACGSSGRISSSIPCIAGSFAIAAGIVLMGPDAHAEAAPFSLDPLPFAMDALEPHMSANTLSFHYGKHHKTYVDNLNNQISSNPSLQGKSLEEVINATWNNGKPLPAFNNAAQVWNHTFFWNCLTANGGGAPSGALAEAIESSFGGFEKFKEVFKADGLGQFGSGWVWLCSDSQGKLKVIRTANAITPIVTGWSPLIVADVWEHAYYLDFQNRRADFLSTFMEKLVDWPAAEKRFAEATNPAASKL